MEIEVTWGRTIRLWWGFLWRYALSSVVIVLLGLPAAKVIGTILGVASVSPETAEVIGCVVGVIAVLFCPMLAIRMLLNKDFGEFRLSLVRM